MSLQLLKIKEQGLNIICLAVAIFFFSLSFNLFQEPNGLVTGGVTGIVLVLHELFGVKISFATLLINLSILALGLIFLGRDFSSRPRARINRILSAVSRVFTKHAGE